MGHFFLSFLGWFLLFRGQNGKTGIPVVTAHVVGIHNIHFLLVEKKTNITPKL